MALEAPYSAVVLVVEDDEATRMLYADFLDMVGYRSVEVATGQAALSALEQDTYDLVVLDRRLPDVDGIDVCKQIRDKFGQGLPVVMVTADSDPTLEAAARSAHVTELMYKPFRGEHLLQRLHEHLKR